MSQLVCALYLSIEEELFTTEKINVLVSNAREKNLEHDITGFLYYKQKHFFQYIEGSPQNIDRLLTNLKKDTRHRFLNCVSDNQLSKRRFEHWSMGQLKTNELIQIKLEDIIIDYLSWMKTYDESNIPLDFNKTWGLIDKLAYFKNKNALSYSS